MDKLSENVVCITHSVRKVMRIFQRRKYKTLYVIDEKNKYLGSITEGDLRRFIIANNKIPDGLINIVNRSSFTVMENDFATDRIIFHSEAFGPVPILNKSKNIVGFFPTNQDLETPGFLRSVTAIAPTRISFAGGGSDLDYWFEKNDGCVVNLAIKKYARVYIKRNFSDHVCIRSLNTGESLEVKISDLEKHKRSPLGLIVNCLLEFQVNDGIDIKINCDFEPGTGLGGSSSLTVALIKGLSTLFNIKVSQRKLIKMAYYIERNVYGISGGWQDQIIATVGSLCVLDFKDADFDFFKIDLPDQSVDYLNSCLFLAPISGTHDSDRIHNLQKDASSSKAYFENMLKIVKLARECRGIVGKDEFKNLGTILDKGWQLKKNIGKFISNNQINNRYEFFIKSGATGGRLLGAGGAGYLLIFVPMERQFEFFRNCQNADVEIERVAIDQKGARCIP